MKTLAPHPVYGTDTLPDLTKVHTRQLLKWYREGRAFQGRLGCGCCELSRSERIRYDEIEKLRLAVKAELDKREHVPNKAEGKRLRRQKAKSGSRDRGGRR